MPDIHSSIVGSSTAYRRMNCPGSQALEAPLTDQESVFALEGTGLHGIMEKLVEGGEAAAYLGQHINEAIPALNIEQVAALQWCLDIVDPILGDNEFAPEQYLDFPGIEGAGGTGDLIVFHVDGSYHILDYKFGRGVPVSARNIKGRTQLLFIACAARAKYGPAHSYHLHILQPRISDGHSHVTVTDRDLDSFENQLKQAVANFGPTYNVGEWCKFCKAEGACPAKVEVARQAHQMRELDVEKLPAALAMVDEIEEWAAAVRKLAHSRLEHGAVIQGWKLVEKRPTRKWRVDEQRVFRKARRAGIKVDQYAPRVLVSPAQLEKLGVSVTTDMAESKSSGTTLARADDPRPAVSREAHDVSELADLMASNRNGK